MSEPDPWPPEEPPTGDGVPVNTPLEPWRDPPTSFDYDLVPPEED
jgi:hypothetical protein